MAKRKYETYSLETEEYNTSIYFEYKQAFGDYNKAQGSATLYGTNKMGECVVIMTK